MIIFGLQGAFGSPQVAPGLLIFSVASSSGCSGPEAWFGILYPIVCSLSVPYIRATAYSVLLVF